MLSPADLAELISNETCLAFAAMGGKDAEGSSWILLHPADADSKHTFGIRITIGWRRIEITFEPGSFAAPLLREMGQADADGRAVFISILNSCRGAGAEIHLRINSQERPLSDLEIWNTPWRRFDLVMRKGNLEIGDLDAGPPIKIVREWALKFAAAIIAILPLDDTPEPLPAYNQQGFAEGAVSYVAVSRYERDRRNRAAAIALHGTDCKGCGMSFADRYGDVAAGFIEIHHVVPVSNMTPGYVVDPARDLVPLCSNCHSVVHRHDPPMPIEQLRQMLNK